MRDQKTAHNKSLGAWGERKAEEFLQGKGYTAIGQNIHSQEGEVDLIMYDTDKNIVAIEVKTRTCNEGDIEREVAEARESISQILTLSKICKIRQSMHKWCAKNNQKTPIRIEYVLIYKGKGKSFVEHITE